MTSTRCVRPTPAGRIAAGLMALSLLLSGCAGPGTPQDGAAAAAEELAQALEAGDVSGLRFSEQSAPDVEEQRAAAMDSGVGDSSAEITVREVSEPAPDGTRTAALAWRWDLPESDAPWTLETQVQLIPAAEDPRSPADWSILWDRSMIHPDLGPEDRLRISALPGPRGEILGADGVALVTQRKVHRVGLDKSLIRDDMEEGAARKLAAAVGIDADDYAASVAAHGPDAFVEAIVLRDLEFLNLDNSTHRGIAGIASYEEMRPLAPTSDFAREILGAVGPATQEDIEASGGKLEAGDLIGQGGLQGAYDAELRGEPGVRVEAVAHGADGSALEHTAETLFEQAPQPGADLSVTLDQELQLRAEDALSEVESPSSIVALRPSTGEILAAANGPGSQGYSTALQGQYAPGSTFKVATSLGLLREGRDPDSVIPCPARITVDGTAFSNAPTYPESSLGEIPLRESVAQSCNTSFISQHEEVDQTELVEAAEALGVGQPLALGLPAFQGSMPSEESGAQHAAAMIGQGRTLVSPLVMAAMAATVSQGELVTPTLLVSPDPAEQEEPREPAQPLTGDEAEDLQELMRAVVSDGHLSPLQELEPDTAIGKTGTAEYGTEDPPRTHSWVIAAHGDLAVAVFVEDGGYGSVTGTPLMLEMLSGPAPQE